MLGLGVDQRRDVAPRFLDQAARGAAFAMHRRRIGGDVERGKHRRARRWQQRRAGIVVEIGAMSGHFCSILPCQSGERGDETRYFLEFPRSAVLFTRFAGSGGIATQF